MKNKDKLIQKLKVASMTGAVTLGMATPVFAAGVKELISQVIGTVGDIFVMIGAVLLIWAIGQLVMAFKNEDADAKSRAIMLIVSSALLISVKTIAKGVLDAAGAGAEGITTGSSLLK